MRRSRKQTDYRSHPGAVRAAVFKKNRMHLTTQHSNISVELYTTLPRKAVAGSPCRMRFQSLNRSQRSKRARVQLGGLQSKAELGISGNRSKVSSIQLLTSL